MRLFRRCVRCRLVRLLDAELTPVLCDECRAIPGAVAAARVKELASERSQQTDAQTDRDTVA